MANGWARDGAVQEQIDDTVSDAVKEARLRLRSALRRVVSEMWLLVVPRGHRNRLAAVQVYFAESIEKRNAKMWDDPNVTKLKRLWAQGLEEFLWQRNPLTVPEGSPAIGPTRKRSMPNIVMIDFADEQKCSEIRGLNDLSAAALARLGGAA